MTEGLRDAFIENDVIGNYAVGTNFISSMATRKSKRKSRKHRKKASYKRRKKRVLHRRKHSKVRRRSSGGIKYTKKGQPYKIMPNGRARFIKK